MGSLEPGKKADVVLLKNDHSPAMFPILNPYGHVFQAQRADAHVVVNGRVVKHEHRLLDVDLAAVRRTVEETVTYLQDALGPEAWQQGMNPQIPRPRSRQPLHLHRVPQREHAPDLGGGKRGPRRRLASRTR